MADKKYIAELSVQTGQSRQNIKEVQDALVQSGDAGTRASSTITHALENIENASANVIRKEHEGRVITEKDGKVLIQQYELLTQAVKAYENQTGQIPATVQAAMGKATAQYELATKKIREASDTLQDQKDVLKEGQASWNGINDALNKVLGRFGGIQVGALAAWAALKEGISIGGEVARAIGTDFSEAESAAHNLKAAFSSITNALVTDGLTGAVSQTVASLHTLGDTLTGNGLALKGYNALVLAGVDETKALALSTDDLKVIAGAHAKVVEGGAAAQKLFNQVINEFDPIEYTKRLGALGTTFDDLARKEKAVTEARKQDKEAIDDSIKSIDAEIQKLKDEIEARRLGVDKLNAEIKERQAYQEALRKSADAQDLTKFVINGLTNEMRGELKHLQELTPSLEHNRTAVNAFSDALKRDADIHHDDLTPATRAQIDEIVDLIAKYKDGDIVSRGRIAYLAEEIQREHAVADATKKHSDIVEVSKGHYANLETEANKLKVTQEGGKTVIANTTDEVKKSNVEWDAATRTMKNVQTAAEKLGDKGGTLTMLNESMAGGTKNASDYRGELIELDKTIIDIAAHAKEAATAILAMGSAAAQAAGASHGATGSWEDDETMGLGDIGRAMATGGI